jgi:hypothetical protein
MTSSTADDVAKTTKAQRFLPSDSEFNRKLAVNNIPFGKNLGFFQLSSDKINNRLKSGFKVI